MQSNTFFILEHTTSLVLILLLQRCVTEQIPQQKNVQGQFVSFSCLEMMDSLQRRVYLPSTKLYHRVCTWFTYSEERNGRTECGRVEKEGTGFHLGHLIPGHTSDPSFSFSAYIESTMKTKGNCMVWHLHGRIKDCIKKT